MKARHQGLLYASTPVMWTFYMSHITLRSVCSTHTLVKVLYKEASMTIDRLYCASTGKSAESGVNLGSNGGGRGGPRRAVPLRRRSGYAMPEVRVYLDSV